ncbi:hypothetical protein [Lactococcus lactis]|uniref:hypothetical protein n=2 Tax=Lactococcus lactis TaxID=1358 RepID=UPI00223C2281|nr:hypothetical protein [Lactococcus lactis]
MKFQLTFDKFIHFAKISLLTSSCVTEGGVMQAKYRGQLVEVWKISHRPIHERWVRHAFEQGRLSWNEWNKNVLNFESISGDLALVGDFLIQKDGRRFHVVSRENVQRDLIFMDTEANFKIGD